MDPLAHFYLNSYQCKARDSGPLDNKNPETLVVDPKVTVLVESDLNNSSCQEIMFACVFRSARIYSRSVRRERVYSHCKEHKSMIGDLYGSLSCAERGRNPD
jgi:hypothetical protein